MIQDIIELDFIIDDNPMKEGYLTPGMDIEICGISLLDRNFEKICFVPLAWNFYNEIKKNNSSLSNNFINIKDIILTVLIFLFFHYTFYGLIPFNVSRSTSVILMDYMLKNNEKYISEKENRDKEYQIALNKLSKPEIV